MRWERKKIEEMVEAKKRNEMRNAGELGLAVLSIIYSRSPKYRDSTVSQRRNSAVPARIEPSRAKRSKAKRTNERTNRSNALRRTMRPRMRLGAWNQHHHRHAIRRFSLSPRLSRLPSVAPLPPNPPDAGHVHLTNRAVVKVSGSQSTAFMNRLVCADVSLPSVEQLGAILSAGSGSTRKPSLANQVFVTSFLNTRGRIMYDSFIFRQLHHDAQRGACADYFIDVDSTMALEFVRSIARLRGPNKIKIDLREGSRAGVFAAWNRSIRDVWSYRYDAPYLRSPPKSYGEDPTMMAIPNCYPDPRAPGLAWRILGFPQHVLSNPAMPGKQEPLSAWQLRRYLCGVPEGQTEVFQDSAFPGHCNHDMVGGVSFFKPAYVGDKPTLETRRRGLTSVRILPVQIYDSKPDLRHDLACSGPAATPQYNPLTTFPAPTIGSQVQRHGTVAGRHAGEFIRATGNVGLARCHLEIVSDQAVHGVQSKYDPAAVYMINDFTRKQRPHFVRPFVPPWLAAYLNSENYWQAKRPRRE